MHVNVSALKTCNFTNLFETIAEQILSAHSGQSLYWPKIPRIQPLQVHNKCICKCSPNFEVDPANSTQCRDIDECTRYPNICQNGKKCFNTPGSYHCECLPGYENDWTSSGACVGVRIYIVLSYCWSPFISRSSAGNWYLYVLAGLRTGNSACWFSRPLLTYTHKKTSKSQ